ncbi:hypothetical protein B0T20DRAFT_40694 [Sordaria brevicollis]|uniref:Uncharacterized protein n=1 Tax=Sordaria brevicollis TaxID=83679 RepID=A0AAE0U9M7_SORBR|nr:hypothetical protein B0T20DRAFT_40694 [Sordaria brevicollis]
MTSRLPLQGYGQATLTAQLAISSFSSLSSALDGKICSSVQLPRPVEIFSLQRTSPPNFTLRLSPFSASFQISSVPAFNFPTMAVECNLPNRITPSNRSTIANRVWEWSQDDAVNVPKIKTLLRGNQSLASSVVDRPPRFFGIFVHTHLTDAMYEPAG